MADSWEIDNFGSLSHDGTADTDSDGLNDKGEYDHNTNPNEADTDGDGVNDGDEVNNGTDPNAPSCTINPATYLFGTSDGNATFYVVNSSSHDITLPEATLGGENRDDFNIEADNCNGVTLSEDGNCTIIVSYPSTTDRSVWAYLNIDNIKAFLHNYESESEAAARRLPPVIDDLNISETMSVGVDYNLTWSVVGYDDTYLLYAAFFRCDANVTQGECGESYGNAERFDQALELQPYLVEQSSWNYNGVVMAKKFHYSYVFNPKTTDFASGDTTIVIRFYYKSNKDMIANSYSTSVIIPGNLSNGYYDTSGRKISKVVHKE
jgi:hypothetical protein